MLVDSSLSVPIVSIQSSEHCPLFQAVGSFFHAREVLRVVYSDGVQLLVVEEKQTKKSFLGVNATGAANLVVIGSTTIFTIIW